MAARSFFAPMLLIYKEKGISSFKLLQKIKQKCSYKKLGHTGTLDPLAEGLLIVLTDTETKKQQEFMGLDKEYEAIARLGIQTTTGDLEGKLIKTRGCNLSEEQITNALLSLQGEHLWEVPLYSAIKVNGKPLYKYARENKQVEIPRKKMQIFNIQLISINRKTQHTDVHFKVKVSSGTYIRTITEKLGEKLNCPATTTLIKRTKIGSYSLKDALRLNEL